MNCLFFWRRSRTHHLTSSPQPSNIVVFPDDVFVEILSLLDVKSLMKLKCVCKSWNLLISDPTFIKLHLKRSSKNPHIAVTYSHSYFTVATFPVHSLFGNRYITLAENRIPFFPSIRGQHVYFVGSCNGLLCVLGCYYTNSNSIKPSLYLWNPATRALYNEIVFLPDEEDRFDKDQLILWRFAFGYDNSRDTYKIVVFHDDNKVRIFNVGGEDNVWRNIQSFPVLPFDDRGFFAIRDLPTNCVVYVSGAINWVVLPNESDSVVVEFDSEYYKFEIITFHLCTETYRRLKPPPHPAFYEVPHR